MNYKLVVTDMDGTLLDRRQKIVPANLEAIDRFIKSGGFFTLATGRTEYSTIRFLTELNINAPAILYNGGCIFDFPANCFISERFLDIDTIRAINEVLKDYADVNPIFFIDTNRPLVRSVNRIISDYMLKDGVICKTLAAFDQMLELFVRKVLVIGEPVLLKAMAQEVNGKFSDKFINFVCSEENYLEFLPSGISKGTALKFLASYLGIPLNQTIAIGDNLNDLELLEAAGIGVAVANAHPRIKEVADYISPLSNEEGAVTEAINRFCY